MNRVAIFGACGEVGQHIDQALCALGYQVTRIGRQPRPDLTHYRIVDLYDQKEVAAVCHHHDLIINAAGPASAIRDNIARVAIDTHTLYVDVGGEQDVFGHVQQQLQGRDLPVSCVFGAGFVPGFTSLLPFIAKEKLQDLHSIELYVGGIEAFTSTSAIDFIASLGGNDALSGVVIRDDIKVREGTREGYQPLPEGKEFTALPYLSAEHQRVANTLSISNFAAFNLVADRQLLMSANESAKEQTAALVSLSQSMVHKHGTQQYCVMDVQGWIAQQPVNLTLRCKFNDGYRMTGMVAAFTVHQLLTQSSSHLNNGVFWLSEIVETGHLISFLHEQNMFSHWDLSIEPNYELAFEEGAL